MMQGEALLAAGCFWGVEESFRTLKGVTQTKVGYSGGTTSSPTYSEVCRGDTGHAEVVHVIFDMASIRYADVLRHFFKIHDPSQMNRQGPDIGRQYRSAIFYYDEEQRLIAEQEKALAAQRLGLQIATEITPASRFFSAEAYHQKYILKKTGSYEPK